MDVPRNGASELRLREQLKLELRAENEQLQKLEAELGELRRRHQKLEEIFRQHATALEKGLDSQPLATSPAPHTPAVAISAEVTVETVPSPAPAPAPAGDGEDKLLKNAQRFARLLVSEIELYNRTVVAEGRKDGNLYARLRTAIDRSRQAYEKRFGNTPAKDRGYFHEELVRTLAANDPSLLGSDYPGPSA